MIDSTKEIRLEGGLATPAIDITHELGTEVEDLVSYQGHVVAPSDKPTVVIARSRVVGSPAQRLRSREYMATLRRREAGRIAEAINNLSRCCDRTDFSTTTYPVLELIKSSISKLQDSETEGNSREVFRQIRDTFLNAGWNHYKRPEIRVHVGDLLLKMTRQESIEPEFAEATRSILGGLGISQIGMPLIDVEEAGKEEIPH